MVTVVWFSISRRHNACCFLVILLVWKYVLPSILMCSSYLLRDFLVPFLFCDCVIEQNFYMQYWKDFLRMDIWLVYFLHFSFSPVSARIWSYWCKCRHLLDQVTRNLWQRKEKPSSVWMDFKKDTECYSSWPGAPFFSQIWLEGPSFLMFYQENHLIPGLCFICSPLIDAELQWGYILENSNLLSTRKLSTKLSIVTMKIQTKQNLFIWRYSKSFIKNVSENCQMCIFPIRFYTSLPSLFFLFFAAINCHHNIWALIIASPIIQFGTLRTLILSPLTADTLVVLE